MENEFDQLRSNMQKIVESSNYQISDMLPSEWAEQNRVMTSDVSPWPGPFSFNRTPYLREPLDCMHPSHPSRIIAVIKGAQIGFSLKISELLPTPTGFTTMEKVKVGDFVIDENGNPVKVIKATDVMYNHKVFSISFINGSSIDADAGHLWSVYDRVLKKTVVINTEKIFSSFRIHKSNRYYINNAKALVLPEKEFIIDPYLLGLWLGDGHAKSNDISGTIEDLSSYKDYLDSINVSCDIRKTPNESKTHLLHIVKPKDLCLRGHKRTNGNLTKNRTCRICIKEGRLKGEIIYKSFISNLKEVGVLSNKHIPEIYLRGSIDQRIKLLQGLMDTDGSICDRSRASFTNTNKLLIDQVHDLLLSLGYTASVRVSRKAKRVSIKGVECNASELYSINFAARSDLPPFLLKRKANKIKKYKENTKSRRRSICDVKEIASVPVKCITVDSPTHLFLAGKSYIPTHNSVGIIENAIGYIMAQNPGNIMLLSGKADLTKEAMDKKIDQMIDSCGLRSIIGPQVIRKRNQRTGDTSKGKEFPGGSLIADGLQNLADSMRQRSIRFGFIDDFEAAEKSSKKAGSTTSLIETRFKAFYTIMKLYYISTPELKQASNIEPVFLLGDQRHYYVPCPHCGAFIDLLWSVDIEGSKEKAGIYYKLDKNGLYVEGSTGYVCQSCGEFFKEKHKYEMNLAGIWKPTAKPSEPGYYSYLINSLYAPPGMTNWEGYVRDWIKANPVGKPVNISELKTFVNTVLAQTFEDRSESPSSSELSKQIRNYEIGELPEALSEKDGNGKIVLLTCASDLNGNNDDARLDYEIVAWSESGSSYSVKHGSIGTFKNRRKEEPAEGRDIRNYYNDDPKSVWNEFREIVNAEYSTTEGRRMKIMLTGVDNGNFTVYANTFIENCGLSVVGLKGKGINKFRTTEANTYRYTLNKESSNSYLVEVNLIKDELAEMMRIKWNDRNLPQQPKYMNYPQPAMGLYNMKSYFAHYESEHRVPNRDRDGNVIGMFWDKRNSSVQNHFWDVRVYNIALKEIVSDIMCKDMKIDKAYWGWNYFVKIIKGEI